MKVRYISVFAVVVLAVLSGMPALSGGSNVIINNAYARYAADTQTQANSNDCDNGATCAITNPLIQGDGSTNAATNTQNPEFNEEGEGHLAGSFEQSTGGDLGSPPDPCRLCFLEPEFIFSTNIQEEEFFQALGFEFRPGQPVDTIDDLCSYLRILGATADPVNNQRRAIGEVFDALRATPGISIETATQVRNCLLNAFNIPT